MIVMLHLQNIFHNDPWTNDTLKNQNGKIY